MKRVILTSILCVSILLALTPLGEAQSSRLKETADSQYKVGQVWSYWTRPHEKNSTFVVVKVEKHPTLGKIVHISLRGLRIKKPNGELIEMVGHVPLTETALDASGSRLVTESADLPEYEQGYRLWKEAFDAGRGRVLSVSIAHAAEELEARLNRKTPSAGAKVEYKLLSERPFMSQTYNPETDKTHVRVKLLPSSLLFEESDKQPPFQSDILLSAAEYEYAGMTPSGERNVRFTFVTKRKDTYWDPPEYTISLEGRTIHQGDAQLYLNVYEVNRRTIAEQWVTLKVPVEVFLQVAETKGVEFSIGGRAYKSVSLQEKYMQSLVKIIQPKK